MRAFLILVAFTVLFLGMTVVGIPFFVSTKDLEARVIEAVKDKTGRTLAIAGGTEFVLFPKIGLKARGVTLSNPPGMEEGNFVSMEELNVAVQVVPLFTGSFDLAELIFVKPVVNLVTDAKGRDNWAFQGAGEGGDAGSGESAELPIRDIRIGEIALVDGRITRTDRKAGTSFKANAVNVSVALKSLDDPLKATGSAQWNGDKAEFKATVDSAGAFIDGKLAGLTLEVEGPALKANYDGTAARGDGLILEGKVEAQSASLRKLAAWSGNALAPGKGLEEFTVNATLNLNEGALTLSDAEMSLDGMKAKGTAAVRTDGPRPAVNATLNLETLDLNTYIEKPKQDEAKGGSKGWSKAPIDFTPLKAVDADLELSAKRVLFQALKFGRSEMGVAIRGGKLTAKLNKFSIYDGTGKGTLVLNGSGQIPGLELSAVFRNVNSFPLLERGVGFDWVEGTANLALDLRTQGTNQRQMMAALDGTGRMQFADGAIRGINVAQMVRGLGTATLSGWNRTPTAKTDFSSLIASFKIRDGVAVNKDLAMASPLLRLTGSGRANLRRQRLRYRFSPKLVGTLKGQGGATDLAGLDVPIIVSGPWAKPDIYPDIEGILDNPKAAYNKLKRVGAAIKQGGAKSLIKSILGRGARDDEDASGNAEVVNEDPSATLKKIENQIQKDPLKAFKKLF